MFTSYAQQREDVMLHRALHHVHHDNGFYIDIGAYDPCDDSVTRHFYEHGWKGINVEPGERLFPSFVEHRPRDINLRVAVTDRAGEVTFHEFGASGIEQLGTLEKRFADRHAAAGLPRRSYTVPAMTLTAICEQYAPSEIQFLKIDVEGHEASVIRGMDFSRFRPWVLVIEAMEPNNLGAPTYQEWDSAVISAGYTFVHMDVVNRYYVANEHPELFHHFSVPTDDYVYARERNRMADLQRELDWAKNRIAELERERGSRPS